MVSTVNRVVGRSRTAWQSDKRINQPQNPWVAFIDSDEAKTCFVTKGDNLRNWRFLIANGLDATTSLNGEMYGFTEREGWISTYAVYNKGVVPQTGSFEYQKVHGRFAQVSLPSTSPNSISETSADNKAKIRFVQNAKEVTSRFQGGVFLGELGQTLRMIRNPARLFRGGIDNFVSDFRKASPRFGRGRGRVNVANRFLADKWLEYSFGWTPLLSDVRNGAEALAKLHTTHPVHQPVRGVAEEETVDDDFGGQIGYGFASLDVRYKTKSFVKVVYRGAVRVQPKSRVQMNADLFGFSLQEFVPTVWELIPYSFLVDYFTNVGDVIEAASFLGGNLSWVNRTVVKEFRNSLGSTSPTKINIPNATQLTTYVAPFSETYRRTVARSSYSGTLVPNFQFELPGFGTKWLNIGALLALRKSRFR